MKLIDELDTYISGQFNSIRLLLSLFRLEAKLAGLTVFPLLINLCMLFVILITLWLSMMALLGYCIFVQWHSYWFALEGISVLNVVFSGALLKYLSFNLKAMSFEKTRLYFSKPESNEHEQLEKATD